MTVELRRGLALASVGLVAGFVLIGVAASGTRLFSLVSPENAPVEAPVAPAPLAPLPAAPVPPAAPAAEEPPVARAAGPTFDVIRVEPDGASVVAGRGQPGATVELLRGGVPFARTRADSAGNFALVPPVLPAGTSEITLRATAPDGTQVLGQDSAVVVVAPDGRGRPLVAVTALGKPTAVLSRPDEPAAGGTPAGTAASRTPPGETPAGKALAGKPPASTPAAAGTAPVKVVSVDAEAGGRLYVTAQGAPKAALRLYLNDTLVAPGQAGPDGRIAFTIGRGVKPGDYRVRIDQVDPASGAVRTRAETAFAVPPNLEPAPAIGRSVPGGATEAPGRVAQQPMLRGAPAAEAPAAAPAQTADALAAAPALPRAPAAETALADAGTVFVPGISTAKVTRGDNLWSISRKAYGKGFRYTVIFDANQGQIRDPNRIYPGQVFVLPGEAPPVQGQAREPDSRG